MTLSIDGHPGDVSRRVTYLSANSPAGPTASSVKAKKGDDPSARQFEGQVADLNTRFNTSVAVIRAGLNYKFNWF